MGWQCPSRQWNRWHLLSQPAQRQQWAVDESSNQGSYDKWTLNRQQLSLEDWTPSLQLVKAAVLAVWPSVSLSTEPGPPPACVTVQHKIPFSALHWRRADYSCFTMVWNSLKSHLSLFDTLQHQDFHVFTFLTHHNPRTSKVSHFWHTTTLGLPRFHISDTYNIRTSKVSHFQTVWFQKTVWGILGLPFQSDHSVSWVYDNLTGWIYPPYSFYLPGQRL